MKQTEAQRKLILEHLQSGKGITPLEAYQQYNCLRLGARIYDLRAEGHNIHTETVLDDGKHYARYWLIKGAV